jgi:hypothetical protein
VFLWIAAAPLVPVVYLLVTGVARRSDELPSAEVLLSRAVRGHAGPSNGGRPLRVHLLPAALRIDAALGSSNRANRTGPPELLLTTFIPPRWDQR